MLQLKRGYVFNSNVHNSDETVGRTTMNDVLSRKIRQTIRNVANDFLNNMNGQILPIMCIPLPQILDRHSKKPKQQTKVLSLPRSSFSSNVSSSSGTPLGTAFTGPRRKLRSFLAFGSAVAAAVKISSARC